MGPRGRQNRMGVWDSKHVCADLMPCQVHRQVARRETTRGGRHCRKAAGGVRQRPISAMGELAVVRPRAVKSALAQLALLYSPPSHVLAAFGPLVRFSQVCKLICSRAIAEK